MIIIQKLSRIYLSSSTVGDFENLAKETLSQEFALDQIRRPEDSLTISGRLYAEWSRSRQVTALVSQTRTSPVDKITQKLVDARQNMHHLSIITITWAHLSQLDSRALALLAFLSVILALLFALDHGSGHNVHALHTHFVPFDAKHSFLERAHSFLVDVASQRSCVSGQAAEFPRRPLLRVVSLLRHRRHLHSARRAVPVQRQKQRVPSVRVTHRGVGVVVVEFDVLSQQAFVREQLRAVRQAAHVHAQVQTRGYALHLRRGNFWLALFLKSLIRHFTNSLYFCSFSCKNNDLFKI